MQFPTGVLLTSLYFSGNWSRSVIFLLENNCWKKIRKKIPWTERPLSWCAMIYQNKNIIWQSKGYLALSSDVGRLAFSVVETLSEPSLVILPNYFWCKVTKIIIFFSSSVPILAEKWCLTNTSATHVVKLHQGIILSKQLALSFQAKKVSTNISILHP